MKKLYKVGLVLSTFILSILFISSAVDAATMSKFRKKNAERIASIVCTENTWKKYGVLPSVCLGQALIESGIGEHAPDYNWWGLASGRIKCYSIEDGVKKYLKVINNGYYKGAPYCTSYSRQIEKIGPNYCNGGSYVRSVKYAIQKYNLTKYDRRLFKIIDKNKKLRAKKARLKKLKAKKKRLVAKKKKEAAKKLKELRSGEFKVVYDNTLSDNEIGISQELQATGTVSLSPADDNWQNYANGIYSIYDTTSVNDIKSFNNATLYQIHYNTYDADGEKVVYSSNEYCKLHDVKVILTFADNAKG